MRDVRYEAYKATVVLLALLETLKVNCEVVAKVNRDSLMSDLAKRFGYHIKEANRLNDEAGKMLSGEEEDEEWMAEHAKGILHRARKMNREARVIGRFFGISTRELTASDILNRE